MKRTRSRRTPTGFNPSLPVGVLVLRLTPEFDTRVADINQNGRETLLFGGLFLLAGITNKDGEIVQAPSQLDPSNLRKVFERFLANSKLGKIRFHDLRAYLRKPTSTEQRISGLRKGTDGPQQHSDNSRCLRSPNT